MLETPPSDHEALKLQSPRGLSETPTPRRPLPHVAGSIYYAPGGDVSAAFQRVPRGCRKGGRPGCAEDLHCALAERIEMNEGVGEGLACYKAHAVYLSFSMAGPLGKGPYKCDRPPASRQTEPPNSGPGSVGPSKAYDPSQAHKPPQHKDPKLDKLSSNRGPGSLQSSLYDPHAALNP